MAEGPPHLRIITISVEPGKDVEVNYDGFHFYEAEAALVRAIEHLHREQDQAEMEAEEAELTDDED